MVPQWIIEKKRDGAALTDEEIRFFIEGYASGAIPDYQASALAMAIYFRGMTRDETAALTDAMMRSGDRIDPASLPAPSIDKHSTGGIGDKVSLVLAPLVACCGVAVPMIAGRGLGITGGTIDKLESIPGYRTDLSSREFIEVVSRCGCAITAQTQQLAPADRKLYALRDVTGTVPSIPLIAASILSKKLAEGAGGLVLDVTWGRGAFMRDLDDARELARTMIAVGASVGRPVAALITDMNQPLGRAVGNAVEVAEALETLRGSGPADLRDVTLALAARMLCLAGVAGSPADAQSRLRPPLENGAALDRFREMVSLQGGDPAVLEDPARLPTAPIAEPVAADRAGIVIDVDAELIGRAAILLGAGRTKVGDPVDHGVGLTGLAKIGEPVEAGQPLAIIHGPNREKAGEAKEMVDNAFTIGSDEPLTRELIVETLGEKDLS